MSTAITLETLVQATQEQVSCDVEPDVIILSLKNGEYYGLNEVGAKIWSLVQEPRSVADIRDAIQQEYPEVDPEECTKDLLDLLEDLAAVSLIEVGVSSESRS